MRKRRAPSREGQPAVPRRAEPADPGGASFLDAERSERTGSAYAVLVRKYRALTSKYEKLVARLKDRSAIQSDAAALAQTALRSGSIGLALVRNGRIFTRNPHWDALDSGEIAEWTRDAPYVGAGDRYFTLEQLAVGEAGALLKKRARESIWLERFSQARTGRTVEIRLEQIRTHRDRAVVVMVHDVTERVRAERDLERARTAMFEQERMRTVGELASGVAHDLNNALHAISMRVAVLRGAVPEPQAENVTAVERIVADVAERVGRLQQFARQRQDAPVESADLAEVIRSAAEVARPELRAGTSPGARPLDVAIDLPPLPRVVGSPPELRHVFLNLLLNARDAMPSPGRIEIAGHRDGGEGIVLTVSDTGVGIPPEHLTRIFDPFFTTKGEHGSGLGLAMVYGVMRRLGGSISAANRPEGGAVFTLWFPVSHASAEVRAPPPPERPRAGGCILVVDDDRDNLEAMRHVLESLGQEVRTAADGEEAFAAVEDPRRAVDLVFCDIGMPGLDGWTVAAELRERAPAARVYLLSGWAREIAPDDPRLAQVAGLLPKPLDLDDLQRLLARELGNGSRPALATASASGDERSAPESPAASAHPSTDPAPPPQE